MKKSFTTRVFRYVIILVVLISSSLAVVHGVLQRNILRKDLVRRGTSMASILAANLRVGLLTGSGEFLEEPLAGVLEQDDVVSVEVYDARGNMMATREKAEMAYAGSPAQAKEALTRARAPVYFEGQSHIEFWAPVYYFQSHLAPESELFPAGGGETVLLGLVRLSLGKEGVVESIRVAVLNTYFVAFLFVLVGATMAYYIAARVTTPLKGLVGDIRAMEGAGITTVRVPEKSDAEVAEVARAFNEMVEALRKREADRAHAEEEKRKFQDLYYQVQRLESLSTLAGGIAHDINNLMGIMLCNLELARMKAQEGVAEYVSKAIGAVERGKEIVANLLNFSRGVPVEQGPVDMGLIAGETVRLLRKGSDSEISVTVDVMPGLRPVSGNPAQLQQVVMNFYLNARDAIMELRRQGAVRDFFIAIKVDNISVAEDRAGDAPGARGGHFVMLTVADNGCGMDKATRARIFEPYFSTKGGESGGLGLSTVYGIVRHLGGWIDVKSAAGAGTEFRVYLPWWQGDVSTRGKDARSGDYVGGFETILVVDDEPQMASATREMLEQMGYAVSTASSAEDAWGVLKAREGAVDLVISDVMMPGGTGVELMEEIRRHWPAAKVVLTGGKRDEAVDKAVAAGKAAFLQKPYSLFELTSKVREVLGAENGGRNLKGYLNKVQLYYVREKAFPYDERIASADAVVKVFRDRLSAEAREKFMVVLLDSGKKMLGYEEVGSGTVGEAFVYIREVLRSAILTNAHSLILMHNHTSGEAEPSLEDIKLTLDINWACGVHNIKLLDHLIIGRDGYYSFAENGLL
ncbi:MAG: ATP-binding protein [Thermodesulfovibrionales bacterium]